MTTVVRSFCHDRTRIAHVANAGFDFTPAGPLGVVKRAAEEGRGNWRALASQRR